MSEHITWASEADFRIVQQKCESLPNFIQWKRTDVFSASTTLEQAVQLAKIGRDGGPEGLQFIKPKTSCFKEWMDYAFVLAVWHNRNPNSIQMDQ